MLFRVISVLLVTMPLVACGTSGVRQIGLATFPDGSKVAGAQFTATIDGTGGVVQSAIIVKDCKKIGEKVACGNPQVAASGIANSAGMQLANTALAGAAQISAASAGKPVSGDSQTFLSVGQTVGSISSASTAGAKP